jgi:fluoride exporter
MNPMDLLLVALGGALGSVCRYLVNIASGRLFGLDFPAGTMIVNITGCFAMGVFIALLALRYGGSPQLRLFVAVGFLGGFTTLSAFAFDAVFLWERGALWSAILYVSASIILSLAGLVAGLSLVRTLA